MCCWTSSSSEKGALEVKRDVCEAEGKVKEIRERVRRLKISTILL